MERRIINQKVEYRADGDKGLIVGYGAVFNRRSENLGGFVEEIMPGAFDAVMQQDVRGLFNHDSNIVLGRTLSGTLRLSVDDIGLRYEIDAPKTALIHDMVIEPMRRGDITNSSFGFTVAGGGADWTEDDDGRTIRTITKIGRLYDVSPVTFPAYPDASSEARAIEDALQELRSLQTRKQTNAEDKRQRDEVIEYLESRIAALEQELAGARRQIGILERVGR